MMADDLKCGHCGAALAEGESHVLADPSTPTGFRRICKAICPSPASVPPEPPTLSAAPTTCGICGSATGNPSHGNCTPTYCRATQATVRAYVAALRAEVAALRQEGERNRRIVELVNAPGSIVKPAQLTGGRVVVVDGRTGLDSCEHTALECFDVLFAEADGGPSPGRLYIGVETGRARSEESDHDR